MQRKGQHILGSKASLIQSLFEKDENLRVWKEQENDCQRPNFPNSDQQA
jgi:hypothetical protein